MAPATTARRAALDRPLLGQGRGERAVERVARAGRIERLDRDGRNVNGRVAGDEQGTDRTERHRHGFAGTGSGRGRLEQRPRGPGDVGRDGCAVGGGRPDRRVSVAASVNSSPWLGVRTSASARIGRSSPAAGAGLRIVVAPASRPSAERLAAAPVRISWPTSTTSPGPNARRFERAGPWTALERGVGAAGHRDAVLAGRVDQDQGDAGRLVRQRERARDTSMPSAASAARASIPNASSPTAPTKATVGARAAPRPRPGCRPCRRDAARTARR